MASALGIKRVVLYKHGVGYFERRGKVTGSAVVHLDFKARDMNDVLKSMTVLDLNGGTISAVSYDSTKPLEKLLEEATIRIPEKGSLTALLGQVKGARVRVKLGGQFVEGAIVGLETAEIANGETTANRTFLTLLTEGALRTHDLLELSEVTFLDEHVRRDLEFYLATVLSSYKKDTKRVALFTAGEGERELFAAYTLEAPVWKTSYRILLAEEDAPTVQGWAVVDNTGDEDWVDVSLTLIAGLPISFRHDLYSPRYLTRPEIRVETEAAAAPVIPEEGFAPPPPPMAAPAPAARRSVTRAAAAPGGMAQGIVQREAFAEAMERSANVQTVVKDVGDLFEYRVAQPVTVRRNQSALVPILHRKMEGRRVLLYNRANRPKNPMAAIELTNSSELTLEGGPVTVSEEGLYVGEAMLDTMKPRDHRFVPFAVELGCVAEVDDRTEQGRVFRAVISYGTLQLSSWSFQRTRYTFRSKAKRAQTLFVEHPLRGDGWELFETPAPSEKTERLYRFKLQLEPGKPTELTVSERSRVTNSVYLSNIQRSELAYYLSNDFIDKATLRALEEIIALRDRSAELQNQINELEQQRNTIHADQERIRENMGSLQGGAEQKQLVQRLTKKLDDQETALERIAEELVKLQKQRAEVEAKANQRTQELSFEKQIGEP